MQNYRAMVEGKIEARIFPATSLSDAQVDMINFYDGHCNQANIIAMTEEKAKEYMPTSIIPTATPFAQFRYEGEIVNLTEWEFTQAISGDCDCGKCLACRAKEYAKENEQ